MSIIIIRRTLIVLSLLLFGSAAQAALLIDDFSGPGFNLCVNQPSPCMEGEDSTLGSQALPMSSIFSIRESARLIVGNAPIGMDEIPSTAGNLDTPTTTPPTREVLSLTVAPSSTPPVMEDPGMGVSEEENNFLINYQTPTLTMFDQVDLTSHAGDRFLIDLFSSDLGLRTVDLTIGVAGGGGGFADGSATTTLSAPGTYEILFDDLIGTSPEIAVQTANEVFFVLDFNSAIGLGPGINLELDNFRVGKAVVPIPSALLLMGSGFVGLIAWRGWSTRNG